MAIEMFLYILDLEHMKNMYFFLENDIYLHAKSTKI